MTRSRRLPDHPIDNIGISPDVIIPYPPTEQLLDKLDVWVEYVRDWLEAEIDRKAAGHKDGRCALVPPEAEGK